MMPRPNRLISESSPYLLQHAYNPVRWLPWGEEAFEKARLEDKPLIISVGYSSCHWCHVMEHESFEDEETAQIMNDHFICIKVDREERPDVDGHYMKALQLMTGSGGWPMNIFALPGGQPFYGGSYFPREQWNFIMEQISEKYRSERGRLEEVSESVLKGLRDHRLNLTGRESSDYTMEMLTDAVEGIRNHFDHTWGGLKGSPKFPLPGLLSFLLKWSVLRKDDGIRHFVLKTLDKMAGGGLFDQLEGGFARYSTDGQWKVPHFEKMLYDNAQLVELYAHAYSLTGKDRYRRAAVMTLDFTGKYMTSPEGLFYSALDADSGGEEGRYYVWEEKELREILGADFSEAYRLYGIGSEGLWEGGRNILVLTEQAERNSKTMEGIRNKLLEVRKKRELPSLDDKSLSSWNALMISAFTAAYHAFGEEKYLAAAVKAGDFIIYNISGGDGLFHAFRNGRAYIEGFMEDYAFMTAAAIDLYEASGQPRFLSAALKWSQKVMSDFFDPDEKLCRTAVNQEREVPGDLSVTDSVLPSPNAEMARCFFRLSALTGKSFYRKTADDMISKMSGSVLEGPLYFYRWAELMLLMKSPFYEVVITGPEAGEKMRNLRKNYLPRAVFAFAEEPDEDNLLFRNRWKPGETLFHICRNNSCGLPVKETDEALNRLAAESRS